MIIRVISTDTDPWEGSLEALLDHQVIPEFIRRRIETLEVGEEVAFDFETTFIVKRLA